MIIVASAITTVRLIGIAVNHVNFPQASGISPEDRGIARLTRLMFPPPRTKRNATDGDDDLNSGSRSRGGGPADSATPAASMYTVDSSDISLM